MGCRATVCGMILADYGNRAVPIMRESIDSFSLGLTKDTTWKIGIDQSTSCTGIAFKSDDGKFVVLLDVHRDRSEDRLVFYRSLKYLLRRLANGIRFTLIVNEKPVPSKYRTAGDVLREFLGRLNEWIEDTPEFSSVRHGSLYPQTWKSLVMDKSKGKNRSNVKAEVALDVAERYPGLMQYYDSYPYSDYDSFEALGILDGYLMYAFDKDGNAMICGTVERTHKSFVCYDWVDNSMLNSNYFKNLFGEFIVLYQPVVLTYNERYNFYTNVRMASSNNKAVCTILPRSELQPFQWKYGLDIKDKSKSLVVFIYKKRDLTRSDILTLSNIFKYKEEIFGE